MRVRALWLWRLLLLGFAVVYVLDDRLQGWVPPLLPFLAAAAVEAQFFLAGLRRGGGRPAARDPGPQERDLAELGWAARTIVVATGDAELVLRPGELDRDEILDWLERHRDELAALGPGRHELAPIESPSSPVAPHVPEPAARPRRRARARLLQALAVLAALGALFLLGSKSHWERLPEGQRAATLAVLERQASRIAGHPAEVICDVSGDHVGYVQDADGLAEVGGRRAWLTPDVCYRLHRIRRDGRAHGARSGEAIAVLAHEAWHLRGETSEARANCFAYQSGVRVGVALGLDAPTARQLMREQLAANPAEFESSPRYVVPADCRRGGSLDLHLDGDHFP